MNAPNDPLIPLALELFDALAIVATRGARTVNLALERTTDGALRVRELTTTLGPDGARAKPPLGVEPGAMFGVINEALGDVAQALAARGGTAWDRSALVAERGGEEAVWSLAANNADGACVARVEVTAPMRKGLIFTETFMDLVAEVSDEAARRQREFVAKLPEHDGWTYDQAESVLVLQSANAPVARFGADVIGSFAEESGTWMWGWANESIEPRCAATASRLMVWARERRGLSALLRPVVVASDGFAAVLASIAAVRGGARGIYRATYEAGALFLAATEDPELLSGSSAAATE